MLLVVLAFLPKDLATGLGQIQFGSGPGFGPTPKDDGAAGCPTV